MYIEERLKTKINNNYDVAVCGGGFAGISAALASARHGKKTVLFERGFVLGGLGTAGIVTIFLPLCDGYGHQISFGIAEELLRLSVSCGAEDLYPENWLDGIGTKGYHDKRFEVRYNPHLFAILAEKLLLEAGVDILYGTYAVGLSMQNNKIEHVITENKSGRQAYNIKSVVDATGDCDIAEFAGASTDTFKQGNILAAWYYSFGLNGYKLNMLGYADIPEEDKKKENGVKLLFDRRFGGLDAKEISEMTVLSHDCIYNDFLRKREKDMQFLPVNIAAIPQLRMTRKIIGEYELSDKEEHKYFYDSIGMIANWKKRGPIYEVPFRTLFCKDVKNLICAGRCTSVNETMWDIMRVIPACAVTGQAAGTAASMSDDFSEIDIAELQKRLMADGVVIHENGAE